MKKIKRLASCVLAVMMIMPTASPAYAKTNNTKTKITAKKKSKKQNSKVKLQKKKLSYRMTYNDDYRKKYQGQFDDPYENNGLLSAKYNKKKSPETMPESDKTYLIGYDADKALNNHTELRMFSTYLLVSPKKANVKWTSSNKKIAYIKDSYQKGRQARVLIHPSSFGKCTISAKYKGKKYNIKINVFPSLTYKKAETALNEAGIKNSMPDIQKTALIAKWCNKNLRYSYDRNAAETVNPSCPGIPNDIPSLFTHKGLCADLSSCFIFLNRLAGIKARLDTSRSQDHAWVNVKIENDWYHIESTNVGINDKDWPFDLSPLFKNSSDIPKDAIYKKTGNKYLDIPVGYLANKVNTDEELKHFQSLYRNDNLVEMCKELNIDIDSF